MADVVRVHDAAATAATAAITDAASSAARNASVASARAAAAEILVMAAGHKDVAKMPAVALLGANAFACAPPGWGPCTAVESSLPVACNRLVWFKPTLEPKVRFPGFKICFHKWVNLWPLQRGVKPGAGRRWWRCSARRAPRGSTWEACARGRCCSRASAGPSSTPRVAPGARRGPPRVGVRRR
jgi:hypothetical protein